LENSGLYFITCECFGKKYVKIGRSTDVATRRRELQTGCPFPLVIEHVQAMDQRSAIEQERRYRAQFTSMHSREPCNDEAATSADPPRMPRWFRVSDQIQTFLDNLKSDSAQANPPPDPQTLLF